MNKCSSTSCVPNGLWQGFGGLQQHTGVCMRQHAEHVSTPCGTMMPVTNNTSRGVVCGPGSTSCCAAGVMLLMMFQVWYKQCNGAGPPPSPHVPECDSNNCSCMQSELSGWPRRGCQLQPRLQSQSWCAAWCPACSCHAATQCSKVPYTKHLGRDGWASRCTAGAQGKWVVVWLCHAPLLWGSWSRGAGRGVLFEAAAAHYKGIGRLHSIVVSVGSTRCPPWVFCACRSPLGLWWCGPVWDGSVDCVGGAKTVASTTQELGNGACITWPCVLHVCGMGCCPSCYLCSRPCGWCHKHCHSLRSHADCVCPTCPRPLDTRQNHSWLCLTPPPQPGSARVVHTC
jgi:hypothetical protein